MVVVLAVMYRRFLSGDFVLLRRCVPRIFQRHTTLYLTTCIKDITFKRRKSPENTNQTKFWNKSHLANLQVLMNVLQEVSSQLVVTSNVTRILEDVIQWDVALPSKLQAISIMQTAEAE